MSLAKDFEKSIILKGRAASAGNVSKPIKLASRLLSANYLKQTTSGKPEAMLKVTSFARGHRVKKLMEYVARTGQEKELTLEDQKGSLYVNAEDISALHEQWKTDFERAADGVNAKQKEHEKKIKEWENSDPDTRGKNPRAPKGAPRHATHIILSAGADNSDMNSFRTKNAARKLLNENFGKLGYEYVFVHHQDNKNPHVHVVVKNYNRELDKKLRLDKDDLFALRQSFAKELENQGIQQSATLRMDRTDTLERISNDVEKIKVKRTWFQDKLNDNKTTNIDLDNVLKQQIRKIHTIEKRIPKAKISAPAKDRIKKELRELKIELLNSEKEQRNKIFLSKVKSLGNDAAHIKNDLKEYAAIKTDISISKPANKKEENLRKQKLADLIERKQKEITGAKISIVKSQISKKQKSEMLEKLTDMQKANKQIVKRMKLISKDRSR